MASMNFPPDRSLQSSFLPKWRHLDGCVLLPNPNQVALQPTSKLQPTPLRWLPFPPWQIIVLILSQDTSFSHNIHKISLPSGGEAGGNEEGRERRATEIVWAYVTCLLACLRVQD